MEFLKPGSKVGGESDIWPTEPLKRKYKRKKIKMRVFFGFFVFVFFEVSKSFTAILLCSFVLK